jgi:hypothetical protein
MISIEDYEIITIKDGQEIIVTHNNKSVFVDHQEKTVSGTRYNDDLLIYDKSSGKDISIVLYIDFNFEKIDHLATIKIGEIDETGEIAAAVLVELDHKEALFN